MRVSKSVEGFSEPRGEITETEEELIITLDIRGAEESSIKIDVKKDYAVVEAKRREIEHQIEEGKEAPTYDYRCMLDLPTPVRPATMKHSFRNGVLEIVVKKRKKE